MRYKKTFIALVVVGIGAYFVSRAGVFSPSVVPPEFESARLQGALIAEAIVGLSKKSASSLEAINKLDQDRDFTEASNRAAELIEQSREIRNKAVELSGELEKMTAALSKINSFEARQAALESISSRLALINRLINYSAYLSELQAALDSRFSGVPGDRKIETIVNQINSEVNAINNFNTQAGRSMERFDEIVKK